MSPSKTPRTTIRKTTAAKKPATNGSTTSNGASDLNELIRQRAYELYLERGSEAGHAAEDWLRAEAEVRARSKERTA
ncbi:MAG: DUF2934 domain-containing protein [Terriglobales bacterium]